MGDKRKNYDSSNSVYLRSNFYKSGMQVQWNIGECQNTVIYN